VYTFTTVGYGVKSDYMNGCIDGALLLTIQQVHNRPSPMIASSLAKMTHSFFFRLLLLLLPCVAVNFLFIEPGQFFTS